MQPTAGRRSRSKSSGPGLSGVALATLCAACGAPPAEQAGLALGRPRLAQRALEDPCLGATCSGVGTCYAEDGVAFCLCPPGQVAVGLSCLERPLIVPVGVTSGERIVEIAVAETGRGPDQVGQDLETYPFDLGRYLEPAEAWCTEFASWVYRVAESPLSGGYEEGGWMIKGSSGMRTWFQSNAEWIDRSHPDWGQRAPAPGDYIRWQYATDGHSGIVRSVTGTTLYTVEGNVSNSVRQRTFTDFWNQSTIDGFGLRPADPEVPDAAATPDASAPPDMAQGTDSAQPVDAAATPDASAPPDVLPGVDSAPGTDAAATPDASAPPDMAQGTDSAQPVDASATADAILRPDAEVRPDLMAASDLGSEDDGAIAPDSAALDSAADAGSVAADASASDSSELDAGGGQDASLDQPAVATDTGAPDSQRPASAEGGTLLQQPISVGSGCLCGGSGGAGGGGALPWVLWAGVFWGRRRLGGRRAAAPRQDLAPLRSGVRRR